MTREDNKQIQIPAVVLGMSVTGLGAARSLGREGVKVYGFDPDGQRPQMRTRYAQPVICPDPQKDPEGLKNFLIEFVRQRESQAVLIPTSDATNVFVHAFREDLEPFFKMALTPKAMMSKIMDKRGQYELAREHGVPVPGTFYPENEQALESQIPQMHFPVLVKGCTTERWRQEYGDKKAFSAESPEELRKIFVEVSANLGECPMIQEIIPGEDTCHYKICTYLDQNQKPLLTFTLQKLRQYPCRFGVGSCVRSCEVPEIAECGINFLKAIGYWGVGSIEFKKDPRDNRFKMIELNPRLWAQNSLPTYCGQNFSYTAYCELIGKSVQPRTAFRTGVKWVSLSEDRASFYGYRREGRMGWVEWLSSVYMGVTVWALWDWQDPVPYVVHTRFGTLIFQKFFNRLFRRRG